MNLEYRHKLMLVLFLAITLSGAGAYILRNSFAIYAFNILMIMAGLWMLSWAASGILVSIKSHSWPRCSYTVTDARLTLHPSFGGEKRWNKCVPFFRINYEFNGKEFSVTSEDNLNLPVRRVFVTPHDASKYLSEVSGLMYGAKLYVNPSEPGMAFLKAGVGRDQIGVLIFSVMTITLPLLTIFGVMEWR